TLRRTYQTLLVRGRARHRKALRPAGEIRLCESEDLQSRRLGTHQHERYRTALPARTLVLNYPVQQTTEADQLIERAFQRCEVERLAVAELGAEQRLEAFERSVAQAYSAALARGGLACLRLPGAAVSESSAGSSAISPASSLSGFAPERLCI